MSHTPRPWIQNGRFVGTASNNDDILNGCHHNEEQALANAKLIAAAPELLKILKKCLKDELSRRKKLLNKSTAAAYADSRIEQMKAAIAKAEVNNISHTPEHSPLPLKADGNDICERTSSATIHVIANVKKWKHLDEIDFQNYKNTDYGEQIFIEINHSVTATRQINAEFIAAACNSHYELLEALKAVEANIEENDSCMGDFAIMVNKIKEAITKAESK
jgi:hypothetical protein